VNDFDVENPFKKGYPEGHVHLRNFLTVPIFQGDEIVGVVGVANKATGYDQEDVIQLQVLMGSVWKEVARKNAEDAQDKLAAQLNQAQKMEAVGRLAGGVAHDFNNILQAMIGYSELLQEMVADRPNAHELVTEVVSEGKRAAGLTNQLLAFARKQAVHPQVIDINEAVAALVKMQIGRASCRERVLRIV
jgi:signal transduction histidine kinase